MDKSPIAVPVELIEKAIYLLGGEKVMLDRDLAELYGVTTSALKQSVRRNSLRFPPDFMFVLDHREFDDWRSQIVISKADRKGLRVRRCRERRSLLPWPTLLRAVGAFSRRAARAKYEMQAGCLRSQHRMPALTARSGPPANAG